MIALLLACSGPADGGDGTPSATGGTGHTGTPPPVGDHVFDDAHVLVVPDAEGVRFLDREARDVGLVRWDDLTGGACDECTGEGASPDGDGLLVSWALGFAGGGVGRIGGDGQPDWAVPDLAFPHDAVRDPADGTVLVPEAASNRFLWIAGDGSSSAPVRVLDETHLDWDEKVPNGIDRIDLDGRTYVVSSNRGAPAEPGRITLWDLTEPGAPHLVWRFPEEPGLDVPHAPIFRRWEDRWWLLWAHSEGSVSGATVGLAVTDDILQRPQYVADLEADGEPFEFLRGVELTDDGELWLVDTGIAIFQGNSSGRLWLGHMPTGLQPTGATGAVGPDQVFVPIAAEVVRDQLMTPFEGWLWEPTFRL